MEKDSDDGMNLSFPIISTEDRRTCVFLFSTERLHKCDYVLYALGRSLSLMPTRAKPGQYHVRQLTNKYF